MYLMNLKRNTIMSNQNKPYKQENVENLNIQK
jgi:hypothetical protein